MRPGEDPSAKTSSEELTRGVVITYVDDLLFTLFQYHVNALTKALLAKYVMKQSGILAVETPEMEKLEGIDFLGARIVRDGDGTIWCDQSKYILHCLRENGFINQDGEVVLTKVHTPPTIDEKLGEEEGTVREKNEALTLCRKYIGQMMWLTRHCCVPRHSSVHDGEATKGSQEPLSLLMEVPVDYKRPCHVHFALPRCRS